MQLGNQITAQLIMERQLLIRISHQALSATNIPQNSQLVHSQDMRNRNQDQMLVEDRCQDSTQNRPQKSQTDITAFKKKTRSKISSIKSTDKANDQVWTNPAMYSDSSIEDGKRHKKSHVPWQSAIKWKKPYTLIVPKESAKPAETKGTHHKMCHATR